MSGVTSESKELFIDDVITHGVCVPLKKTYSHVYDAALSGINHRTPREKIPFKEPVHGVRFVIAQNLTSEMTEAGG